MIDKKKIIALSGSTRKASSNLNIIKAIEELSKDSFTFEIFYDLAELPHFNPDLDNENVPENIIQFRKKLKEADGILICTPEYAIGVPGTLKNAIDWTVSSMEFSHKPVALITASLSGEKAHKSLLGTLLIIESRMTAHTQLLISYVKTKLTSDGKIKEKDTLADIQKLINSLNELIRNGQGDQLTAPILMNDGVNSGE